MVKRGRKTISESRWPNTPDFVELAKTWRSDAITVLLNFVWQGYDLYQQEVLSKVDRTQADDQIERTITQDLAVDIDAAMSGLEPFIIQPERFEMEMREPPPARPKQYDLAFVWRANRRITWPLEAKILHSDGSVSEYVKEITNHYLTCRYAPFSNEAGMLGYLLKGNPQKAFDNIAKSVPCALSDHPDFSNREHKTSNHQRKVPMGESYACNFRCHHLILEVFKKTITKNITVEKVLKKTTTKKTKAKKTVEDS